MAYPSHIVRSALRRALREHPGSANVLAGRVINSLSRADLNTCLIALGLDPLAIARDAMLTLTVDPTTHMPGLSQNEISAAVAARPAVPEDPETMPEIEPEAPADDPVETEVQTIRSLIVEGGFSALDARLRELVTEARKPAVEIRVEVPAAEATPGHVHVARPTGAMGTWKALFGIKGALAGRETALWDGSHPNTPRVNDRYLWPHPQTETALAQISRGRNVMLYGPAGTGKTEWAQQLAAQTGRPFALISCDNGTDAATLVGMTVPDPAGGVVWQDGILTRAIRTPGCVVCLDEPSVARPGALFVLQNVLANRTLFVAETGAKICCAPGVLFIATDNTNGTGGGARKGYTDTNRLNAAFLDRFGVRVKVDYLAAKEEAAVLVSYTGCPPALAQLLVTAAAVTRAAADNQTLSHGIGLRRLLSWAELLMDGIDPAMAFESAILNCASEQDVETLREQCLLTYDQGTVAKALAPVVKSPSGIDPQPVDVDPALVNPTPAGRNAAADFSPINGR